MAGCAIRLRLDVALLKVDGETSLWLRIANQMGRVDGEPLI
jgi:hypothetical protein